MVNKNIILVLLAALVVWGLLGNLNPYSGAITFHRGYEPSGYGITTPERGFNSANYGGNLRSSYETNCDECLTAYYRCIGVQGSIKEVCLQQFNHCRNVCIERIR